MRKILYGMYEYSSNALFLIAFVNLCLFAEFSFQQRSKWNDLSTSSKMHSLIAILD